MSRGLAATTFDFEQFEDSERASPASAMVRGADGRMMQVDIARLAWPDEDAAAGVDLMADLSGAGPFGRC